jgi:Ser/Thr protein kinase RdoA (MazF antagonist)
VTLVDVLHDAFGWRDISITAGARGALGRIWRVSTDDGRYAVKEIFFEAPQEAGVEAELMLVRRAMAAGVRAPQSRPDRRGRYVVTAPDGRWLRAYEWVDMHPLELAAPTTARQLGDLIARLHRCAPAAATESGGEPPSGWYSEPPSPSAFTTALASGAAWVPRLGERLADLPQLAAIATPVDAARLRLCHRDLHPGNVLADEAGVPVVVDWDNVGPAAPERELAQALFDWWCDGALDADAMRATYEAYGRAGGPARITELADFTTLVATRLNFLLIQLNAWLDEGTPAEHRAWAETEIDEALRILPTPDQLAEALELTRSLRLA